MDIDRKINYEFGLLNLPAKSWKQFEEKHSKAAKKIIGTIQHEANQKDNTILVKVKNNQMLFQLVY